MAKIRIKCGGHLLNENGKTRTASPTDEFGGIFDGDPILAEREPARYELMGPQAAKQVVEAPVEQIEGDGLDDMTKKYLLVYAVELGCDVNQQDNKANIIQAIRNETNKKA